ncbi:MAG TPA: DUF882 domain-containing protein [Terriglobales bacterium]|nr:DUF882 domain-containing protein [Terriglobales bacterium]
MIVLVRVRVIVLVLVAVLVLVLGQVAAPLAATEPARRFFFSGDGALSFRHAHFDTDIGIRFRRADGSYDAEALARLRHFFRSRGDGREGPLSLRLVELIDYLEQRLQPKRMILVSAYRSPEFNDNLRSAGAMAARASLHTQGMAADVMFEGVRLREAWNRMRKLRIGGLGLYEKDHMIHIDSGPPRFWEASTSKVGENISGGNARLFGRTEFDRYDDLAGATVTIHGVTKLPLAIAAEASAGMGGVVMLAPQAGVADGEDGCLVLREPAEVYALRVVRAAVPAGRMALALTTCEPRLERTAATFASNEVEVLGSRRLPPP